MNLTLEEITRGHILKALDVDDDQTLADTALLSYMRGLGLDCTHSKLRKHLAYLEGKGLIMVWDQNSEMRMAQLQPEGKDVIDGREKVKGVQV